MKTMKTNNARKVGYCLRISGLLLCFLLSWNYSSAQIDMYGTKANDFKINKDYNSAKSRLILAKQSGEYIINNETNKLRFQYGVHGTDGTYIFEGKVGIGTDNPQVQLDVKGNVNVGGQVYASSIYSPGTIGSYGTIHTEHDLTAVREIRALTNLRAPELLIENTISTTTWHINNGSSSNTGGFNIIEADSGTKSKEHRFFIKRKTGNVGIGTATPTEKLEVAGNIKAYRAFASSSFDLNDLAGGSNWTFRKLRNDDHGVQFAEIVPAIGKMFENRLVLRDGGKIGIGTAAPTERLDVAGNVNAERYYLNNKWHIDHYDGSDKTESLNIAETGVKDHRFFIQANTGKVGIDTNDPQAKLDVHGSIKSGEMLMTNEAGGLRMIRDGEVNYIQSGNGYAAQPDGSYQLTGKADLAFTDAYSAIPKMILEADGKLVLNKIKTDDANANTSNTTTNTLPVKLQVEGKTITEHLKTGDGDKHTYDLEVQGIAVIYNNHNGERPNINEKYLSDGSDGSGKGFSLWAEGGIVSEDVAISTITGWADYVFEDDYFLKPLEEVDAFIKQNKHLPGIPTAAEAAEGFSLVDMNVNLLEKVEELTLYTIEQDKQITQLKQMVEQLLVNGK